MTVDAFASSSHYLDHLADVWAVLGDHRGRLWVPPSLTSRVAALGLGEPAEGPRADTVLTASWADAVTARRWNRVVLMEHGIGQTYRAGGGSVIHPAYAGGSGRCEAVDVFLCPNERAAMLNREACPRARVKVIGSPYLDALTALPRDPVMDVACTWHWDCRLCPETRATYDHWWDAMVALGGTKLGHGHPRVLRRLAGRYRMAGIPVAERFEDVVRNARVLVADNTSALYFGAALGMGVVVLNHPSYRRDVHHGLRFWDCADIGVQVGDPDALGDAVEAAMGGPSERACGIVGELFPWRGRAVERAVRVLLDHAGR